MAPRGASSLIDETGEAERRVEARVVQGRTGVVRSIAQYDTDATKPSHSVEIGFR